MAVSCGIVGLPNVGKSTLFNALTAAGAPAENYPFCTIDPNVAVVEVPDPNLERIARHVPTERIVPTHVRVVDIAGLISGASKGEGLGNQFLANIRETDAILQVVRCFESARVVREDPVDPRADVEVIETELCLADLDTCERALERAAKKARAGDKEAIATVTVLERATEALRAGRQLRGMEWRADELQRLRPLCPLTLKPTLFVANVVEDDVEAQGPHPRALAAHAGESGARWIPVCVDMECELSGMTPEERAPFLEELGAERFGLARLIQAVYSLLGLQTFYTAGPKEVRAWTIPAGTAAPQAAGVIHTDFEKGFIRAECYSLADLDEHGSEAAIRAAGKLRTEGRDYVLRPDDVCHFLVGK